MIHLGDITKIKGYEAPVVDCVIGGSPCQDLSVAGKRAGLAGERSGLFMEQIRVIKEMRENDKRMGRSGVDVRCRYGIWENVPGALSSPGKGHAGEDFAAVLEEFVRVAEPEAPSVSVPKKGWPTAGCLYDEMGKWSVAWRIMDAQYWGVPQRRRRICLVADFNGLNAPKIVFGEAEHHGSTERIREYTPVGHTGVRSQSKVRPVTDGLPGNPDSCQSQGQETAGDAGECTGGAIGCDIYNLAISGNKAVPLTTAYTSTGSGPTVITVDQGGGKSGANSYEDVAPTLTCTHDGAPAVVYGIDQQGGKGGANYSVNVMPPMMSDSHGTPHAVAYGIQGSMIGRADKNGPQGDGINEDVSFTLNTTGRHAVVQIVDQHILDDQGGSQISVRNDGKSPTLRAEMHGNIPAVLEAVAFCQNQREEVRDIGNIAGSLSAERGTHQQTFVVESQPTVYNGENITSPLNKTNPQQGDPCHTLSTDSRNYVVREKHIVRRLTPMECERLQGFPDGWTLIGEPVEDDIPDYELFFDESKYVEPRPEDYGLTEEDVSSYADIDEEYIDDDDYWRYIAAFSKARSKATKKVKVGSHKEVNYYYTDSNGKRKKVSDSARYKALGNSIAIPPWKWVLKRLCACYERDATMASLFDGIGGFPLIWEQINGKGSCLWASEVDEFPMAVTKVRFGGNNDEYGTVF